MKVLSTQEMRLMDRAAVEKYGIPEEILMENAGESSYFALKMEFGLDKGPVTCVCGVGNNGGDGLVVARKLFSMKQDVFVFILGNPDKYKGPARLNFEIIRKLGIPFEILTDTGLLERRLKDSYVVVDAIFGTGLMRPVEGLYADVISIINQFKKRVLSIDIPSGINGDNGRVMNVAVKADVTVTYGLPKYGNLLSPGFAYNGRLYLTHISFPPGLYEDPNVRVWVNHWEGLPERPAYGHKGTFGSLALIGGASSYFGAPVLGALSFLKAGGGYSRLLAPASMIPFMSTRANEVVFVPMEGTLDGYISMRNIPRILEVASRADILVIGPGLGIFEDGRGLIAEVLSRADIPVLLDADGLTLLSGVMEVLGQRRAPTILTPHPKEMERLSGIPVENFLEDPVGRLREFTRKWKVSVVYKTARSLISCLDGRVYVNITGNSGMGTAGAGDVLTGTIAAQYCRVRDVALALRAGTFVHGLAGDLAALQKGEEGITANDILECLPMAHRSLSRDTIPSVLKERYELPRIL